MIRTYSESGRSDEYDGIRMIALGRAMKDFPDGLPSSNGWDEDTSADRDGVEIVTVTLSVDDDPAAT